MVGIFPLYALFLWGVEIFLLFQEVAEERVLITAAQLLSNDLAFV